MAEQKKMVEEITSMEEDFAKWYTDVVKKAELASYSCVRGCMVVRPYGTALWENIRDNLDRRFKALGHENVMMPLFIPESLLQKEKDHVEGFAPEVAWVTHGGAEQLGNLRQAFLVSLFGESEVLAVSLRFSSESVHQILFGLAHGKSPLGIVRLCRVCCLRSQSGTIPVYKNPALL